jgi:hypothetical protein
MRIKFIVQHNRLCGRHKGPSHENLADDAAVTDCNYRHKRLTRVNQTGVAGEKT